MLDTFKLKGGWHSRPDGQLGSCGYYPYTWTMVWGSTAAESKVNFLEHHKDLIEATKEVEHGEV